jgi:hypothetical protein
MRYRGVLVSMIATLVLVGAYMGPAGAGPVRAPGHGNARLQMYEAVVDATTAAEIISLGTYDVVSSESLSNEQVRLVFVLYPWERQGLEKQGVPLTLWTNDQGKTATELATQQAAAGYKVWRDYDNPDTGFDAYIQNLGAQNPDDLVQIHDIGTTEHGRTIWAIELTQDANGHTEGTRPAVLYTALQHAREWISGEVNRRLLEWYIKKYHEGVPQVVNLLDSTELWFVLVANPDGYQYTFDVDRLWRKNTHDNNGDDVIDPFDGVDPNRNFPDHWGYDDEGSSPYPNGETYRGTEAADQEETKALMNLYDDVDFAFHVNYHSFGQLLLYSFGWQVQTPSADDPIFVALSGTDKKPAIQDFNPGVGADLYITNGETTDFAHSSQGTLAWTPELSEGSNGDGFVFPDSNGQIDNEFKKNLPFALDVALSADDPDDPESHLGLHTKPFYLDVSQEDPQKAFNPMSSFAFAYSYGDPQPVQILAKRDLDGDGNQDPVTVHWSVNGNEETASTSEWNGGDRFGDVGDEYYRIVRGEVTGFDTDDDVQVWFTGGGKTSASFTFHVVTDTPNEVLILAAEDYSGAANNPLYASSTSPNYLSFYEGALDANDITHDLYDVDAMGRVAPDHLGVLSHYEAVIWYTGNDYLTREPGQVAGTGAATLANSEILQVRSYLNEGGHLLYTGRHAGWQYANAFSYNPVSTPPFCDGTIPNSTGVECLLLSDDFQQYYLGAYSFIEDGGTCTAASPNPDCVVGEPAPIDGIGPFGGTSWTLNGGTSADNHHPNPIRGTTQSFLTTSSLQPQPEFTSSAVATWNTGVSGAFEPHLGSGYVYSDRANISYKRLVATLDVPAAPGDQTLDFWTSYDTERYWDYVFVEARTPDGSDWVTLPDLNGHTSNSTGLDMDNSSCAAGWADPSSPDVIHPHIFLYQGAECSGDDFEADAWNAASGRSAGWEHWDVDLSNWAGGDVELSISYVSDWEVQGVGAFVDDIDAPGALGDAGFEAGLGPDWTVQDGVEFGSAPNANNWYQTGSVGFQEGAAVTMAPTDGAAFVTLYFGFGFEGITEAGERNAVMGQAMAYLGI